MFIQSAQLQRLARIRDILHAVSLAILLFRGQAKALIGLFSRAVWKAPLLFACITIRFSREKAGIYMYKIV